MDTYLISATFCLGLVTVVLSWWALKEGGYFATAMLPGVLVLVLGLAVLARWAPWRGNLDLSAPIKLAIGGLLGLAVWSALSALWSPSPDVAIEDAQRIAGYAICFGLGVWLCNLLGPRMHLALAPVAIAAGVAGLVAAGAMLWGNDIQTYLETDGTLQYPLGYRNANAAFFAIAVWPALGLARTRDLGWVWRAAALGAATLSIEMAMLSQSRGSVIGIAAALAVYVILSQDRARALAWLALATLPAIVVIPALTDLYSAANEGTRQLAVDEMRGVARAAFGGLAVSCALGILATRVDARLKPSAEAEARANRVVTIGVIAGIAVSAVAFVIAVGNPIDFFEQRVQEFRSESSPAFEGESSRFGFNTGTERADLWGIALEDAGSDPLFGDGGGGFQYSYMKERSNPAQNAKDAHSVELEVLSELGIPGLAFLALALAGAAAGALRSRRLGPAAATVSVSALAAGAYWLAHSSIDWFWTYAVVTAPVMLLAGAACAPAILAPRGRRGSGRSWVIVGALVLALSIIPLYLSDRYTQSAFETWRADPARAFSDLDRARSLNPFAEEPWLAEGAIARESGDTDHEIEAFTGAVRERPEEWSTHYFLANAYLQSDPRRARRELDVALELNPLSERLKAFDERLSAIEDRAAKAEKPAGKGKKNADKGPKN